VSRLQLQSSIFPHLSGFLILFKCCSIAKVMSHNVSQALTHCPWRTLWGHCWNGASNEQTHVFVAQSPEIIYLNERTEQCKQCHVCAFAPYYAVMLRHKVKVLNKINVTSNHSINNQILAQIRHLLWKICAVNSNWMSSSNITSVTAITTYWLVLYEK